MTAPTLPPCLCGCSRPAKPKGQYASAACRARAHLAKHPKVDLAEVPEAQRPAVIAAAEQAKEVLLDGYTPKVVALGRRDPRFSGRTRVKEWAIWEMLGRLASEDGVSRSEMVEQLVMEERERRLVERAEKRKRMEDNDIHLERSVM